MSRTSRNKECLSKRASSFLGYGDPSSAKVWFVGLEDSVPFTTLDELHHVPVVQYLAGTECKTSRSSVYNIMSKIIVALRGAHDVTEWRKYRDEELFMLGGDAFLVNLYPLGKPVEDSWPTQYRRWLGMSRKKYYCNVQSGKIPRFLFLRQQQRQYKAPLTICFGKNHWPHFAGCFGLDGRDCCEEGRYRFYPASRFVMTEFFRSTRMSDVCIDEVVRIINEMSLNPFKRSGNKTPSDASSRLQ